MPTPDFTTTHWSVLLTADESNESRAADALEHLGRHYWFPLYAYARRKGHDPHEAQDLTQAFFEGMMKKRFLRELDRTKGKFRSYLLACFNHFLANEWRDGHTLKRGGGITFVPLDTTDHDERLTTGISAALPPEEVFDQQWAMALLEQAMGELEREATESNRRSLFEAIRRFLAEPTPDGAYDVIAAELGLTPRAVSMAVLRLRQRYRDLVRAAVAETVTTPLELQEELRYLRHLITQ